MIHSLLRRLFRLGTDWPEMSDEMPSLFETLFMKDRVYLQKLCRYLPIKGEYSSERNGFKYSSELDSRSYEVMYRCRRQFKRKQELEISVPVRQKFWLRLLPQTNQSPIEEEIQLLDPELDAKFIIHTDQPDIVKAFLLTPFIRKELLFLPIFSRFEVYRGYMKMLFVDPQEMHIKISEFEASLNFVVDLASFYELQQLSVTILPRSGVRSLCPYCREKIAGSEEKVKHCDRCGVGMHGECWLQNGNQCTTWGCATGDEFSQQTLPF